MFMFPDKIFRADYFQLKYTGDHRALRLSALFTCSFYWLPPYATWTFCCFMPIPYEDYWLSRRLVVCKLNISKNALCPSMQCGHQMKCYLHAVGVNSRKLNTSLSSMPAGLLEYR